MTDKKIPPQNQSPSESSELDELFATPLSEQDSQSDGHSASSGIQDALPEQEIEQVDSFDDLSFLPDEPVVESPESLQSLESLDSLEPPSELSDNAGDANNAFNLKSGSTVGEFPDSASFENSAPHSLDGPVNDSFHDSFHNSVNSLEHSGLESESLPAFEQDSSVSPFMNDFAQSAQPTESHSNENLATENHMHVESTQTFTQAVSDSAPKKSSAPKSSKPLENVLDSLKTFSEKSSHSIPVANAMIPFNLRIEGALSPQEQEKLLDVLSRENMGFREVDLETQLADGRVFLPRISEYAGILIIQALRGIQATISFKPAGDFSHQDSHLGDDYSAENNARPDQDELDAMNDPHAPQPNAATESTFAANIGGATPTTQWTTSADQLPTTQGPLLPQLGEHRSIDTLMVSGLLSTKALEAKASNEYEKLTDALLRELKFKAARRGARGIVELKIQLTSLNLPTEYRVSVTGTAVQ